MEGMKTKTIRNIEDRMETVQPDSVRYRVLMSAKSFKTSWIDLGQALYAVWRDKLYKGWGYSSFDTYTSKEIGIRKETALKLTRSYYFLEKEDPRYLKREHNEATDVASLPTCDTVNALRLAKKKPGMDETDYASIKKDVLERGKDIQEVKKEVTALMRERDELKPEEARKKRKIVLLKRFLSVLKSIQKEAKITKMISTRTIGKIDSLVREIEVELP